MIKIKQFDLVTALNNPEKVCLVTGKNVKDFMLLESVEDSYPCVGTIDGRFARWSADGMCIHGGQDFRLGIKPITAFINVFEVGNKYHVHKFDTEAGACGDAAHNGENRNYLLIGAEVLT